MGKTIRLTESDLVNLIKHVLSEEKNDSEITEKCWKGYTKKGMKTMFGKRYPNCVKNESEDNDLIETTENETLYEDVYGSVQLVDVTTEFINEAEYQGRKVQLGKVMQGDVKKSKVYVKNDKGKVVKVNFGFGGKSAKGKRMPIKKNDPARRKAFRARHNCDNPGPRWKPRYWSCKAW
jgi:hypothetical protein